MEVPLTAASVRLETSEFDQFDAAWQVVRGSDVTVRGAAAERMSGAGVSGFATPRRGTFADSYVPPVLLESHDGRGSDLDIS